MPIMTQIETLLCDTKAALNALESEIKKSDAPHFRIFDYLRDDEMGLSRCLADMLNPDGLHGQNRVFLDAFVKELPDSHRFIGAVRKIQLEQATDKSRRIDIYIEFENGAQIGIENKPWTIDQFQQLSDYANFLNAKTKRNDWLLVYLCNSEPSADSITPEKREQLEANSNFKQINFYDFANILESKSDQIKAEHVRVFTQELIKFIRHKINMEIDTNASEKISTVVTQSDHHLRSALLLEQSMAEVRKVLMQKLKQSIESNITNYQGIRLANGCKAWCDEESWWNLNPKKGETGFSFMLTTRRFEVVVLRFLFNHTNQNSLFWRIATFARQRPFSDEARAEQLRKYLSAGGIAYQFSDRSTAWGAASAELKIANDWQTDVTPWIEIRSDSEKFAQKFLRFASRIKEILDANDPL